MAKRAPVDSRPFTALDKGLAASVLNPTPLVEREVSVPAADPPTAVAEPRRERQEEGVPPVQRAVEPLPSAIVARRPVVTPKKGGEVHVEKLSREKRVLLSPSEEREIERCVDRIAEGFGGTPVKLSHVVRACLQVVRHAESQIIRRAEEVGQLSRPPNGDTMAMVEFEHEIAKVLSQAFRDAPPLR